MSKTSLPKLTAAMKAAGIVQILAENYNGSYVCRVQVGKINLHNHDSNYRKHNPRHSDKLSANFYRRAVRNPIVRYHKGCLISIDGRHTATTLSKKETIVTCDVHFRITKQAAARIFHELVVNCQSIKPWDAHRAALDSELEYAQEIDKVLSVYDFTTPNSEGVNNASADWTCYTPLLEAFHVGGGFLQKFVDVVALCFTDTHKEFYEVENPAKKSAFLRGLIDFLQDEQFIDLSATKIAQMIGEGMAYQIAKEASRMATKEFRRGADRGDFKKVMIRYARPAVRLRRAA